MPSQNRSPHSARAKGPPQAQVPTSDMPTPTRLTMALAWVFVLGMLVIGLVAIFLALRAL